VVAGLIAGCGYKTSPRPAAATIPGEVKLVEAHGYPDRIVLKWEIPGRNTDGSPLTDLSGFKVYRSVTKLGEDCVTCEQNRKFHQNIDAQYPSNAVIDEREAVYTDARVEYGWSYHYAVSAYNFRGREGPVSPTLTVDLTAPPPAPTGLKALFADGAVRITWDAPAKPGVVDQYRVYRGNSADSKDMSPIGLVKAPQTYFVDKGAQRKRTYFYGVRALAVGRGAPVESLPSDTVSIEVPAFQWGPPAEVNTAVLDDGVRIYWRPVFIEDQETRYNIYRSEGSSEPRKINDAPLRNPWFMDKDVKKNITYKYSVSAFPSGKLEEESARSAAATVTFRP
jgi:fibronectin type 3 domain-containing protein